MVRTQEESRSAIPADVLAEILLLVPAEHLVKLKRVSKSWHRVITDNYFVREHLRRERSRRVLLLNLSSPTHAEADNISYLPIGITGSIDRAYDYHIPLRDFLPKVKDLDEHTVLGFRNIQSFDGLLLMEPDRQFDGKYQLHVCNPVTRSFEVVPVLCGMQGCHWTIGYDPSVQCYKVVGLRVSTEKQRSLCYIFELGGDRQAPRSWKPVDGPLPPKDHIILAAVVCAKGKIHWLFSCGTREGNAKSGGFLVSMNLATGQFSSRELGPVPPRWPDSIFQDSYLGSEGVFYLVTGCCTCTSRHERVLWTLKDFDNPVWVKRRVLSLSSVAHLSRDLEIRTLIDMLTKFLVPGVVFEDDNKLIVKFGPANFICDMNTGEWSRIVADHGLSSDKLRPTCRYYQVYHVNSLISWD